MEQTNKIFLRMNVFQNVSVSLSLPFFKEKKSLGAGVQKYGINVYLYALQSVLFQISWLFHNF
jgi:hypothetical protein